MPKRISKSSFSEELAAHDEANCLSELSTDGKNLLDILQLVVDIEYRRRYGGSIDWRQDKGYSQPQEDNEKWQH